METTEFRFRLINTILTTILVVGVFLAWQAFRGDQEQRRRGYTMHLYDEWRQLLDLSEARVTLELVRSGAVGSTDLVQGLDPYTIRVEGATEDTPYKEVLKMRQHIISILNLFEQVAVADRDHVGDTAMIQSYFSDAIINHFDALKPFISEWTDTMGRRPSWGVLEEVVENWRAPDDPRRRI